VTISSHFEWCLPLCIGLSTHKTKLFFETYFPIANTNLAIVKNNCISSGPNNPTSSYANFFEDGASKVGSSINNHV